MKYAICNELFGDWPWEKGFAMAREFGYTGLEVAPFTLATTATDFSMERRRQYRQTAEQYGLEVIGLHWLLAKTEGFHLTTSDRSIRQRTSKYLGDLARLCRDLGGNLMVLGSPMQRNFGPEMTHSQAMENAAETLRDVVTVLEDTQVKIAVEPLGPQEGNFLLTAAAANELIDRIGSSNVQLHLDVKAMSSEGTPIDEIIRTNASRMIHFHANDPNRLGPGMGDVDFRPILAALQSIDYQGWISVEVFDYSPGVETILEASMKTLQSAGN